LTSYVPDAVRRLQELRQDLSGTSFDLTETFTYNPAGQITSKTVSNDAAYTAIPSPLTSTTTAVFDGQNQLTQFAGSTVTDDANGNVWTGLGLSYTYDALGQLRQASGGANPVLVDYDPAGMLRRVQVGSTTTEYLYDGGDLIAQYNGATVLRRFVHGASADEPLVVYEGSGTTDKSWLHADERGSIIAKTNASGVAASSVKYRPDGDSGALSSVFGYTGQLYLPELQLYYYKARMYSLKAGRFVQPDPIGYADGMNRYSYVSNDPVNFTDPSGLCDLRDVYTWVVSGPYDGGKGVYTFSHQEGVEQCLREFFEAFFPPAQAQQDTSGGGGGESPPDNVPGYREYQQSCMQYRIGSLGWALDGVTSVAGFDTDLQGFFAENYQEIESLAGGGLLAGQYLAQPRVRSGTALGRMIQGEVMGARAGVYVGRALGGRPGMIPGLRAGRVIGGVGSRVLAVPAAFLGGYVASSAVACSVEYLVQ